jgi:hypothetical protein
MERRFGYDFSTVRVHCDAAAEQSAREVNARAYAIGSSIVFGAGQYAPGTRDGRRLIAHELAHVIQSAESIAGMANSKPPDMLMRQPAGESKIEQSQKSQTTAPAKTSAAAADPCTAADPQLPVYKESEQKQRDQILQHMLRGVTDAEKQSWCKGLRRALGAFSTSQMRAMKSAGVRFWRAGEYPPPFKDEYAPKKAGRTERARYQPEVRIIQWGDKAGVDDIRHELAHAWDHVRSGKVQPLDAYKGAKLKKEISAPVTFSSETAEKRLTVEEDVGGKKKKVGLSINDMYRRFLERPATGLFGNPMTDPEEVQTNVREFYAEGYSVFHGDHEDAQAQLLCYAPELYQLLEKEAREAKLAIPDRGKLIENNKTNKRQCVNDVSGQN